MQSEQVQSSSGQGMAGTDDEQRLEQSLARHRCWQRYNAALDASLKARGKVQQVRNRLYKAQAEGRDAEVPGLQFLYGQVCREHQERINEQEKAFRAYCQLEQRHE